MLSTPASPVILKEPWRPEESRKGEPCGHWRFARVAKAPIGRPGAGKTARRAPEAFLKISLNDVLLFQCDAGYSRRPSGSSHRRSCRMRIRLNHKFTMAV